MVSEWDDSHAEYYPVKLYQNESAAREYRRGRVTALMKDTGEPAQLARSRFTVDKWKVY
jgi:hypothetical protein